MDFPKQRIPKTAACFGYETTQDIMSSALHPRNVSTFSSLSEPQTPVFLKTNEGFGSCYLDVNQFVSRMVLN